MMLQNHRSFASAVCVFILSGGAMLSAQTAPRNSTRSIDQRSPQPALTILEIEALQASQILIDPGVPGAGVRRIVTEELGGVPAACCCPDGETCVDLTEGDDAICELLCNGGIQPGFSCQDEPCVAADCPPNAQGSCCDDETLTPGCDDLTCCSCVCAFDPFCCETQWDDICANEATGPCEGLCACAGSCDLDCAVGSIPEGEDDCAQNFVDTTNGGCNAATPQWTDLNFGDVVCGTAGVFVTEALACTADADCLIGDCGNVTSGVCDTPQPQRDEDWYRFEVTQPQTQVQWCVTAEYSVTLGFWDDEDGACNATDFLDDGTALAVTQPCEEGCVSRCFDVGSYSAVVYPSTGSAVCGRIYNAELTTNVGGIEDSCLDNIDGDCDTLVDCADPDCAADPACGPINPVCTFEDGTVCQAPNQMANGTAQTSAAVSDLNPANGPFVVADNFLTTLSGTINEVCFWGTYNNFAADIDCTPGATADDFTITYYLDDNPSGFGPGTLYAGPFNVGAVTKSVTGLEIGGGLLNEVEYTAMHADVDVDANSCYWISINNDTSVAVECTMDADCQSAGCPDSTCGVGGVCTVCSSNECVWAWETSAQGDDYSSQDTEDDDGDGVPDGWGPGDSSQYDLAWCVNTTGFINPDSCGAPPVANDDCENPVEIFDGVTPYFNIGAITDGPDYEGVFDCVSSDAGADNVVHNDIWFQYTATCTDDLIVSTCEQLGGSADYDTKISVHEGCGVDPCPDGAVIGCNDDDLNNDCGATPNFHSTAIVPVTQGNCYTIRVGGFTEGSTGLGDLLVQCGTAAPCTTVADCGDTDNDGFRDDVCLHYACVDGTCVETPRGVGQSDMGGSFGACANDGTCDGNDRFLALNCFGGTWAGDPCEPSPPAAINVDAGGSFGSCVLDGVCDGNDAFAALNCFAGDEACPCGGGPQPVVDETVTVSERTAVSLVTDTAVAHPGDLVAIEVHLDDAVRDLRGYQLHLAATGGRRGGLELVDIAVEPRKDRALVTEWQAFNLHNGQMVAGLDGHGAATRGPGYLATFTYRVGRDAEGTFVVDLLHDDTDPAQRTFLFPTPRLSKVAITSATPARIEVRGLRRHSR